MYRPDLYARPASLSGVNLRDTSTSTRSPAAMLTPDAGSEQLRLACGCDLCFLLRD